MPDSRVCCGRQEKECVGGGLGCGSNSSGCGRALPGNLKCDESLAGRHGQEVSRMRGWLAATASITRSQTAVSW